MNNKEFKEKYHPILKTNNQLYNADFDPILEGIYLLKAFADVHNMDRENFNLSIKTLNDYFIMSSKYWSPKFKKYYQEKIRSLQERYKNQFE